MATDKSLSDLRDRHAVRKVLLHKSFNRALTFYTRDVASFRNPQLFVFRKCVVRLSGVQMQIDANSCQKLNASF